MVLSYVFHFSQSSSASYLTTGEQILAWEQPVWYLLGFHAIASSSHPFGKQKNLMAKENGSQVQIQIQPCIKCVTLSKLLSFSEFYCPAPCMKQDNLESSSQGCLIKKTIYVKHMGQWPATE